MAKNKKKSQPQQKPSLSPDLYMRRVMRTLPIEKCYVNIDWREQGMAHVVVVRHRPDGKFAVVNYLVDTYCLGVKDALWHTRMEEHELESYIDMLSERIDLAECDYATVHNLILGAVEFAQEGGIEPCREWAVGQYGLDEDSDDIDLIEFDYGRDGRHFLNTQTRAEGAKYLPILRAHLGDNFDYQFEDEVDNGSDDGDYSYDIYDEEKYQRPDYSAYPTELHVKHAELLDILEDNETVSVGDMAKVAVIDRAELIDDLGQIARFDLREIYQSEEEIEMSRLFHIVTILNTLADPRGLDLVLDILRMDHDNLDINFGDMAPQMFASAIASCSEGRLADIEAFLDEPGRTWYNRTMVLDALDLLYHTAPKAVKNESRSIIRRQLWSLPDRVDELETADREYAAFVCSTAMSMGDREMLPLIKTLYDNDQADPGVCGNYSVVEECFGDKSIVPEHLTMSEIYCWSKHFNEPYGTNIAKYNEPDYEHLWG